MRRTLAGLTAFLAFSGTLLVLPVYAAPQPEAVPVETSSAEVDMGSVADPAPEADVQAGTSDPVAGVPATTPVLTVSREDTDRFSLVGVTWAYDPAVTDTVVQVRVRDGDAAWGAWTEVTVEDADQDEDAAAGAVLRGGTAPLWTGPSTGVEAELVTRSGARPTDVTLDLVDPGTSEADGSLGSPAIQDTADAAMAMPDVYSRAQWGADESIRTWDPEYAPTIRAATLHHTADTNNYTADQVPAMMRSIYRYHTVSRGWGDIGYNVIVDKYGRLWEGRYGGLASTVVGAHAGGFNSGTFGVSMLGNYDTAPTPQVMVDAVSAIIAWKFSLYGVDPAGTVTLTSGGGGTSRYAAGARVTLPTIFGHRDVGSTTCPGQYGYARLGEIRTKVAATLAGATSPIEDRYAGDAALRTQLGAPVGAEQLVSGVWVQSYARGRVYWTAATGAHALWGAILDRYLALGGPAVLGPPTTDHSPAARPDTYLASFRNGTLYWTQSTGARWVKGWVLGKYTGLGGESSVLGFPTSDEVAVPGGVSQSFQGGMVFSSAATGAHEVHGWVLDKWTAMGGVSGALGFPTSDEVRTADGVYNTFVGGAVFSTPSTGAHEVHGWIGARWLALGAGSAAVGFPVSDELPVGDGVGVYNQFSNGVVVSSPSTGAHDVRGALAVKWSALGGAGSFLGYPTADQRSAPGGGQVAAFSGGSVYWSSGTGAFEVHGWIRDRWLANGGPGGGLGYPTSDEQPAPGGVGVFQTFANGLVFSSPSTGAREVRGLIEDEYTALGGLASSVGVPVTDELTMPDGFGRASVFSSGAAIYYSPASGAWQVRGWIRGTWSATNAEAGFLGYPLGDEESAGVPGAVLQRFQGGRVYSSGATGAREVHGSILARYLQLGGPASSLGLPVSNEYRSGNVARSDFQRGSITCNLTTGAVSVVTR